MNSVLSCMVTDRIGPDALNIELALSLSRYLGVKGGFCLTSYVQAIQYALDLLDLEPEDSVIISAIAPSIYLEILKSRGLRPLIVDVDPDTGIMLLSEIEKLLDSNPKAVILHYVFGFIPGIEDLFELGIPVLEDISHVLGGCLGDRRCGSFGRASVLSFAPGGIITSGGGGAVFAREKNDLRKLKGIIGEDEKSMLLPDMNAALGISQLKEIDRYINRRKELEEVFRQALMRSRHSTFAYPDGDDYCPYTFPVIIKDSMKQARQYAARKKVEVKPAFSDALINFSPAAKDYPNARGLVLRCLQFPLYPSLVRKDIQLISRVLSTLP